MESVLNEVLSNPTLAFKNWSKDLDALLCMIRWTLDHESVGSGGELVFGDRLEDTIKQIDQQLVLIGCKDDHVHDQTNMDVNKLLSTNDALRHHFKILIESCKNMDNESK